MSVYISESVLLASPTAYFPCEVFSRSLINSMDSKLSIYQFDLVTSFLQTQ